MQTIQLNIQKPVDYKSEFEIKYSNFINIIDGHIIFEGKSIKDVSYLDDVSITNLSRFKYYPLYSNYMLLEHFKTINLIRKNMTFNSFRSTILNEIIKEPEDINAAIKVVMDRMLSSFDYKLKYHSINDTDVIVKSISSGRPITASCKFSINESSEGFDNTVLVFGIIRDNVGNIVGINAHDYAGNANTNYQNKNGNVVSYFGELYSRMFKDSLIGIPIEETV